MPITGLFKRRLSDKDVHRLAESMLQQTQERGFTIKSPNLLQKFAADLLGDAGKSEVSKPYQQSIWVYRAVNLWLRVAQVPEVLKDRNGALVESGEMHFLINNPNQDDTQEEFNELKIMSLALWGEYFVLREGGDSISGTPKFLTIAEPASMILEKGDVQQGRIVTWTQKLPNNRKRKIDAKAVSHLRLPNPYSRWRGQSPLVALRITVDADFAARVHNRWQQERHGRISNVISFKEDLDADKLMFYKKLWKEKYEGKENAGSTAFFDNGAEVKQLSLSMKDMDWLNSQRIGREEICAAFGIPPPNAGILDKATYSNFEQSSRSMWEDTLVPLGNKVSAKDNKDIVKRSEPSLAVSFSFDSSVAALQTDEKDRISRYKDLVQNYVSPENAAKIVGLDLGEITQVHQTVWVPFNVMPASDAFIDVTPEDETQAPATTSIPAHVDDNGERHNTDKPKRTAASHGRDAFSEELRQARGRSILRDALPFERKMMSMLKRFFNEQRTHALKNLNKVKADLKNTHELTLRIDGSVAIRKPGSEEAQNLVDKLLAGRDWDAELVEASKKILTPAAEKGALQILAELNRPADTFQTNLLDSFFKQQAILVQKVNVTTREALSSVTDDLLAALQDGDLLDDTIDAMRDSMKDVYKNTVARRRTIARTESMRSLNGGRHEQMLQAGVPMKEWLTVRDSDVRETHMELDGTTQKIDDPWITSSGASLMFPGDPSAPPGETINDRCTTVAVLK